MTATTPGGDSQQVHDFEVFAGLRHDAVVGGDDQQREVDARRAGDHVLHEPLVSGHVDQSEMKFIDVEMGEAQVDGNAAGLFFGKAVGVDAGQLLHQARLAVVDVPGGADDHMLALARRSCQCSSR